MSYRPEQRPATHGSRTVTVEHTPTPESEAGPSNPSIPSDPNAPVAGVLKLRGAPTKKQRVVWAEETIDNEGMGKKKSKICCIYHKPRAFDESSSESSSSEGEDERKPRGSGSKDGKATAKKRNGDGGAEVEQSSESDGGQGDGRARPARKARRKKPHHHHEHGEDCNHAPEANKYDIQPTPKP